MMNILFTHEVEYRALPTIVRLTVFAGKESYKMSIVYFKTVVSFVHQVSFRASQYDNVVSVSTTKGWRTVLYMLVLQMPYPPVALALAAMLSVNTLHHFVLNVDCRSQEVIVYSILM